MAQTSGETAGKRVTIVGVGGNIGSHLAPHMARLPGVREIIAIDADVYEEKNLLSQDITARDVGMPKAVVQARRLRRIDGQLAVQAIYDKVENIPLGRLRADLMISCLDSKATRLHVNQAAWRLGMPLIDAGVAADNLLARVNVYLPGECNACLECGWSDADYGMLEQSYPCQQEEPATSRFPTNAPSSLGALAASLQAIEAQKILSGETEQAAVGREVLIDASAHRHFVTTIRRRSDCRFDHEVWKIKEINQSPERMTLGDALALTKECATFEKPATLSVEGMPFVIKLTCPGCANSKKLLRLRSRLSHRARSCGCGRRMLAGGFDIHEGLNQKTIGRKTLQRSLASLGFRTGDVFTLVSADRRSHFELKG